MTELTRNEIVRRWRAGASMRRIARELGLARNTVSRALRQVEARRAGDG
ncbi:MAG: helix-turn-helix domain-containing protein [Isosphaeraceae bacterium]